jgi:hypothetical protein
MDSGKLVKFEQLPTQGNYSQEQIMEGLQRLTCTPGLLERLISCVDRMPQLERYVSGFEDRCRNTVNRCDAIELLCRNFLCPGNVNYSQRTLDEYSGKTQIKLEQIVTGLGDPYVNAYPVPPSKKIRLTHKPRPGYTPTQIRIDLNIAGGGNNYSDFLIQFFLVPGGVNTNVGLEVGDAYDGNMFLNKDGTQIAVPFPDYRALPLDIGSLETLAVVISNNGAVNNLDSAHVNIFYDNSRFYELCKARSGCGGSCSTTPPQGNPPQ